MSWLLEPEFEKTRITLQLHGYERVDAQRDVLEAYFIGGDERRLMQVITVVEPELVEVTTIEGSEKD